MGNLGEAGDFQGPLGFLRGSELLLTPSVPASRPESPALCSPTPQRNPSSPTHPILPTSPTLALWPPGPQLGLGTTVSQQRHLSGPSSPTSPSRSP